MGGSGTLAIEQALAARGIAPGLARRFGFERWPSAGPASAAAERRDAWRELVDAARAQAAAGRAAPAPAPIVYADVAAEALAAARRNAAAAGVAADIQFRAADVASLLDEVAARWPRGTVCTNPPYGERLAERDLAALYRRMAARSSGSAAMGGRGPVGQPPAGARDEGQAAHLPPPVQRPARGSPAALRAAAPGTGYSPGSHAIPEAARTLDRRAVARLALSALAAVLMFLSAPTFDLWPLMWVGIVPQIYVALDVDHAAAGVPARLAHRHRSPTPPRFFWMRGFLEHFGHMSALEALPIMMLLTSYQGLEFAFLSWGIYRVRRRAGGCRMALVAPLVMVAIELCMPQIFPFYLAITQALGSAGDPDRRPHRAARRDVRCWSRSTARSTTR